MPNNWREHSSPINISAPTQSPQSCSPQQSDSLTAAGSWGASPPCSAHKHGSHGQKEFAQVKKFYAKIRYSDEFYENKDNITVGFVLDKTSDKRRSGVDAWSQRVHSVVVDIDLEEFAMKKDKKFHRVKYFKQDGVVIWASNGHYANSPNSPSPLRTSGFPPSLASSPDEKPARALCLSEDLLPDEVWMSVFRHLRAKELCTLASVSKHLNAMVLGSASLWTRLHDKLFGTSPESNWGAKVVKHVVCKSERKAARWLDGEAPRTSRVGFANTSAICMDDTHVVSGDGENVRVWVHRTDRRIKTLKGHTSNVSCVEFDASYISSGDVTGFLKIWSMDELKSLKSIRAHQEPISDALHFNSLCITSSLDGTIKFWDLTMLSICPAVLCLRGSSQVYGMAVNRPCNRLYGIGTDIEAWDLETAQRVSLIQEEGGMGGMLADAEAYYGYPVDVWPGTGSRSKAIACGGSLLASASKGIVNLYDTRTSERCCSWQLAAEHDTSPVARASSSVCSGLYMDGWKLLCGFKDVGDSSVFLYDIRAASSTRMNTTPALELSLDGDNSKGNATRKPSIQRFALYDSCILAGVQKEQCVLWDFDKSQTRLLEDSFSGCADSTEQADKRSNQKQATKKQSQGKKNPKHKRRSPHRGRAP